MHDGLDTSLKAIDNPLPFPPLDAAFFVSYP